MNRHQLWLEVFALTLRLRKIGNNIIVTGLITEDDCMVVCDITKEIYVKLTDLSFKVRRIGNDNKHVEVRFTNRKFKSEKLENSRKLRGARHSQMFF